MRYRVIYSKRKSIALIINKEMEVVVRVSSTTPVSFIERFILRHENWIYKRLRDKKLPKPKQFVQGEKFLYLGKEYTLHILPDQSNSFLFDNAFYLSLSKLPEAKFLFENWYKKEAEKIILERARFYSSLMSVKFNRLSIKNTSSRWGSCSTLGNLNFCWRLVLAPLEIIDYVIVHELAHLIYKNHSQNFWKLVAQYYPNPKLAKKWLNVHGGTLVI